MIGTFLELVWNKPKKIIENFSKQKAHTSERADAYASAFSWPETVKNAGFPKKSLQQGRYKKSKMRQWQPYK